MNLQGVAMPRESNSNRISAAAAADPEPDNLFRVEQCRGLNNYLHCSLL